MKKDFDIDIYGVGTCIADELPCTDDQPCCAHMKIAYVKTYHARGTCSDSWKCEDCGIAFGPIAALPPKPKPLERCSSNPYYEAHFEAPVTRLEMGGDLVTALDEWKTAALPPCSPAGGDSRDRETGGTRR